MPQLFDKLSREEADSLITILAASGIPCDMEETLAGWSIHVNETDIPWARETLERYWSENSEAPAEADRQPQKYPWTISGLWVGLLLVSVYAAVALWGDHQAVNRNFGASARRIVDGEYYRLVTALLLHGSIPHLAGNMAGLAVFGSAVCSILGWGVGWLAILLTGILGNLLNAHFHETGHLSIGASTAVFGSIGLLSAHQFVERFRLKKPGFKAWIYLGGGLALLGFLGSGKYTDVMAHFFGFSAGLMLGVLAAVSGGAYTGLRYQRLGLVITLLILIAAWVTGPGIG
jgi:membrane associated rhomboid family serine protease